MGRAFAGILGPLAFALVVVRGISSSSGVEGTLALASAALFVFATIGYIAGQMADHLVNESVRRHFQAAMAAWEENEQLENATQPKPVT